MRFFGRDVTVREARFAALIFGLLVGLLALAAGHRKKKRVVTGAVQVLSSPRKSDDAAGRAGDLVLTGVKGGSLTIAAAPDLNGHVPLLGAIVDVGMQKPPWADVSDPLIWFRTVTASAKDEVSGIEMHAPAAFVCLGLTRGVRAIGIAAGFVHDICVRDDGWFTLESSLKSLKDGESLVDWINVGSLPFVVDGEGSAWDMEHDTSFVAFARAGTAVLLTAPRMHVSRTFSHFGAETFPSPVLVRYGGDTTIKRSLAVVRGDVLSALELVSNANRVVDLTFGADRGGRVSIRDEKDRELAFGEVGRGETRVVAVPPGLGTHLELRDERGVVTDARVELPAPGARIKVQASPSKFGTLSLAYRDQSGTLLPVHVLFKGLDGTPDPEPLLAEGRANSAGRSLYLLDGTTLIALAPGHYRVTASHGFTHSLLVEDVTIRADGSTEIGGGRSTAPSTRKAGFPRTFTCIRLPAPTASSRSASGSGAWSRRAWTWPSRPITTTSPISIRARGSSRSSPTYRRFRASRSRRLARDGATSTRTPCPCRAARRKKACPCTTGRVPPRCSPPRGSSARASSR